MKTSEAIPFYDYLVMNSSATAVESGSLPKVNILSREIDFDLDDIIEFGNYLQGMDIDDSSVSSETKILNSLLEKINNLIPVKESALQIFDDNRSTLIPYFENLESKIYPLVKHYFNEGILSYSIENFESKIYPVLSTLKSTGSKFYLFIIPITEKRNAEKRCKGLFSLLTTASEKEVSIKRGKLIRFLVNLSIAKIDTILLKRKLGNTLSDLATYQAKLNNDFKLAAVGELTVGIASEIISPLQVITTQADILSEQDVDKEDIETIKNQIQKIQNSINRLIKFSANSEPTQSLVPCSINEYLRQFVSVKQSSFTASKIECVKDLDDTIPPILSTPNYIVQIISNAFDILKTRIKEGDGIIFQTRYKNENIIFKIVSSVVLPSDEDGMQNSISLSKKILENLLRKHEGRFELIITESFGSSFTFYFPIKRKLRV